MSVLRSSERVADTAVDWSAWQMRWDAQQGRNIPDWEPRFAAMLDALEVLLPERFVALDLACGPGSISRRVLDRFPGARCVALDWDPVLLALGNGVLGDAGGRLRWVEADLVTADWFTGIGEERLDVVLSTTALHWLSAEHLSRVYRALGQMLRPGGILLNGDYLDAAATSPALRRLIAAQRAQAREDAGRAGAESWKSFWAAVAAEPALAGLYAERERRYGPVSVATRTWAAWAPPVWDATRGWVAGDAHEWTNPVYEAHAGALADAGFSEISTIWQGRAGNRVLMAVR